MPIIILVNVITVVGMSVVTMLTIAVSAVTMPRVAMSTVARPFTLGSEAIPVCWVRLSLWVSPGQQFLKVQLLEWLCIC